MASRQLLLQRLAALSARSNRLPPRSSAGLRAARCFSQAPRDGNDDDDDEVDASDNINGDNPFERLLQHSAQFRRQMAEQGAWPPAGEKLAQAAARRASSTVHERDQRAFRAMRSVRHRVLDPPDAELDYEHALSSPQHASAKELKFQQILHREQDKNRVCRNCGERGHVAKRCLLPLICSNCGGVGHLSRDCVFPDYTREAGDVAALARRRQTQQTQERVAEKQRMGQRYTQFQADFAAEIDEYVARSAALSERRRKSSAERKLKKTQDATSQAFKPVIG
ncbi:hypothetical protein PybrP1_002587 [[Pythium] brassicae (nom. inval.)]|nr:hypothetical protein PybrP1_002587 [[Pythium] brassicae (nom. inval.)]